MELLQILADAPFSGDTFIIDKMSPPMKEIIAFVMTLPAYLMLAGAIAIDCALGWAVAWKGGRMSSLIGIIGAWKKFSIVSAVTLAMCIEPAAGGFPVSKIACLIFMLLSECISIMEKWVILEMPFSRYLLFMFRNRIEKYGKIVAKAMGMDEGMLVPPPPTGHTQKISVLNIAPKTGKDSIAQHTLESMPGEGGDAARGFADEARKFIERTNASADRSEVAQTNLQATANRTETAIANLPQNEEKKV